MRVMLICAVLMLSGCQTFDRIMREFGAGIVSGAPAPSDRVG